MVLVCFSVLTYLLILCWLIFIDLNNAQVFIMQSIITEFLKWFTGFRECKLFNTISIQRYNFSWKLKAQLPTVLLLSWQLILKKLLFTCALSYKYLLFSWIIVDVLFEIPFLTLFSGWRPLNSLVWVNLMGSIVPACEMFPTLSSDSETGANCKRKLAELLKVLMDINKL